MMIQPIDETPKEAFAEVLRTLMLEKRITASELARKVWGTMKDYRGYEVARNRDRVGHYLSGKSFPEKENLQKIAKALGVPFEKLAASQPAPTVRDTRKKDIEFVVHTSGPHMGEALLSLNKITVSLKSAMQIMEIVKGDPIYLVPQSWDNADIGKPVKRARVMPLSEPTPAAPKSKRKKASAHT